MKKSPQKSHHSKKIRSYSTMAATIIAANQLAKAGGVIYTDVDPDNTIGNIEVYALDLNNDNMFDFMINLINTYSYYYGGLVVYKKGMLFASTNQVNITTIYSSGTHKIYGPVVHNKGDIINENLDWYDDGIMGIYYKLSGLLISAGDWAGVTDKYAALKLISGNDVYFGWVRMDMAADMSSITIKDFAYNSTAGNKLATGDTVDLGPGASIKETTLKNIYVYSFKNKVYVNSIGSLNEGIITISNTIGQTVYTSKFDESQTQIAIDENVGNFYFVTIQTKDGVFSKKIFLKK